MKYQLYPSVEAMVHPDELSRLLGYPVTAVTHTPLVADFAHSGSGLEYIRLESPPQTGGGLVLKRIALEWDWLMRVTADERCRSTTVWSHGILDRLPAACAPPVIACATDGAGWAILMPDYSGSIMSNRRFTPGENQLLLDTLASMHAAFLEDPRAGSEETGLCTLRQVYRLFAPATAREQLERVGAGELPARVLEGWELAREVMPRDVMEIVDPLLIDPSPLCSALNQYPRTLVHGDFRHSNLGVLPRTDQDPPADRNPRADQGRVVLLDWQLAAFAPPSVELGRYIGANSPLLPTSKEICLEYYRRRLEADLGITPLWWQPQLDLGMLGGFVQDGWSIVLKATHWHVGADAREHWKADLQWWAERVRRGAARLV